MQKGNLSPTINAKYDIWCTVIVSELNTASLKKNLRTHFIGLRKNISPARRSEGSMRVFKALCNYPGNILSFCSMGFEIDLWDLNHHLAQHKRLLCNRIEGGRLVPYFVENISEETTLSPLGFLEPLSSARKAHFSEIALILVPGCAFDREGFRLGYGKGYYDSLLATAPNIPTKGIAFHEQLSKKALPHDTWDVPVHTILCV